MSTKTMIVKHKWGTGCDKGKFSFEQKCDNMLAQGWILKHKWYSDLIGGLHEAHFIKS